MPTPYPALFEPLSIGHLRLKNRIMSTSHAPAYAEDGMPKERYRRYHEEKAKGGLALSMFGGSSTISVDSPPPFGQIDLGDDRVIPWLQSFSEALHRHGCATMIQITHMGRRTGWSSHGWLPTIAPSAVREPAHRSFPKAMDHNDIERVIGDFAAAAGRAQRGGLDGCELSVLGHLGGQFWSPAVNRRTDGYGGTLANRARFTLETLEAMRERTGGDRFLIGMRFTMDELLEEGLREDEAMEIVRMHVDAGLVDFLNVTVGTSFDNAGLSFTVPNMSHPIAPHIDRVKRIRDAFGIPVFHANRVADLASANRAVKEGCVDMIGMTRAHIADPHLVAKLARGEEHRVRTCVGAGYCIDRIYVGADALCLQNPATGRERRMPHVIEPSDGPRRKVVVVGAGPAGLEAARVSASRGHDVVLFEAADEPGGQVRLAARATWRRDLIGIVRWLADEVEALGVDLRLGTYAEPDDVLGEAPGVVIVATGGLPNTGCVDGAEHVVSLWDVLSGQVQPGSNVLLFDDHGDHQGPSGAEFLAAQGAKVELVTPDRSTAFELGATNFSVHLKHLYRAGVTLTPDVRLASVRPKGNALEADLRNVYSGETSLRTVDQVVVEHGTVPAAELFDALKARAGNRGRTDLDALARGAAQPLGPAGTFSLFRVGDAVTSRNIHAALYDSLRICKDL